jgi:hypothetical protein
LGVAGGEPKSIGDVQMKGFIATFIAIGVLWVVDAEYNAGRYGDVVKKAAMSILQR